MLGLLAFGAFLLWRSDLAHYAWFLKVLPFSIALPYIANSAGWIMTEVGRQPWIVFGLQRVEDAVSPNLTPGMVVFSLVAFALTYGVLMVADVYLLAKYSKQGPQDESHGDAAAASAAAK